MDSIVTMALVLSRFKPAECKPKPDSQSCPNSVVLRSFSFVTLHRHHNYANDRENYSRDEAHQTYQSGCCLAR